MSSGHANGLARAKSELSTSGSFHVNGASPTVRTLFPRRKMTKQVVASGRVLSVDMPTPPASSQDAVHCSLFGALNDILQKYSTSITSPRRSCRSADAAVRLGGGARKPRQIS